MADVNREFKDRLFTFMYGSPDNVRWTLSLYNAVNGTDHDDPSSITFTTLQSIVYMSMRNDVSLLLANQMSLYEQQSTFNPNMPLRMLQYLGNLYEKHVTRNRLNKYGTSQIMLPVPRFVVFYNGTDDKPDELTLRLSDAFPPGTTSDVEVSVRMLNINRGRNKRLLDACETLREYAWLVDEIRIRCNDSGDIEKAIDDAIEAMPDDFEIKGFLKEHKAEVKGMLVEEYDEAKVMELFREEGREEGRAEGVIDTLRALVDGGLITTGVAAGQLGVSEAAFLAMSAERASAT